ncbi:MAG: response regulator [Candidatus Omnitrophota bacterium]|nr:response regulator [Candidatus Omnitrophota bacterium]MDZ4243420.1 response regulator [Candidatus Omnitrophota bacterium]
MKKSVFFFAKDGKLCEQVEQRIKGEGFEVITGEDGNVALKTINVNNVPSLVVLESTLEGIDTPEVCKTLRSDARTARLPILIIKDKDTDETVFNAFQINAYLTKPFSMDGLVYKVRQALSSTDAASKSQEKDPRALLKTIGMTAVLIAALVMLVLLFFGHKIFK